MTKEKKPRAAKTPVKARVRGMFGRRFFAGGYAALAALLVIAVAVAANALVSSLPQTMTQLDLTGEGLFTLGDQTRRVAASLEQDVTLYLLAAKGGEDATLERLLARYASLSDHITAENVDPTEQPAFLDAFDLDLSTLYANSVLVKCGTRTRLVGYDEIFVTSYGVDYNTGGYTSSTSFEGESALTNAIHYVSSASVPTVYQLTGHGEMELSEALTAQMERDNLQCETLSLLSLEEMPEDAAAVIVNAPASDLSEDEAKLLIEYAQGGGGLVVTTQPMAAGEMENLRSVLRAMGVDAGDGLIVEDDQSMRLARYPFYLLPEIASHEITDPLIDGGYYALLPLAQPIVETGEGGATVTPLLTTSESAYAKAAGLQMTTTEREDGDASGPFTVGAASELGEGKLLYLASADALTDNINAAVSGANGDLFLNALGWMCGQEETIAIRARSLDTQRLTVTLAQNRLWSFVLVGLIPAACVALGAAVTIRRRRR